MPKTKAILLTHPRSGSTLLRLTLGASEKIIAYDEVFIKDYSMAHGYDQIGGSLTDYLDMLMSLKFQNEYRTIAEQKLRPFITRPISVEEQATIQCVLVKIIALQRPLFNFKFLLDLLSGDYKVIVLNRSFKESVESLARVKAGEPAHSDSIRKIRASFSIANYLSAFVNILANKLVIYFTSCLMKILKKSVYHVDYKLIESQLPGLSEYLEVDDVLSLFSGIKR